MPKEIIDSIFITALQLYDKYKKLNLVEIPIKLNTIVVDVDQHKNYKYSFLMSSL